MIENHLEFMAITRRLTAINNKIVLGFLFHIHETCDGLLNERNQLLNAIKVYDERFFPGRQGPWMMMASGRRFWPLDPRPEDVHIEDIAHNLSMLCRFSGSVRKFYSVSQHSVLVSREVNSQFRLAGLLHDGSEGITGDLISPIKRSLDGYKQIENKIMDAICIRFGLPKHDEDVALWREVKRADNVLLSTEFRDVARGNVRIGLPEEPPSNDVIRRCWKPKKAKRMFLQTFHEITGGKFAGEQKR